MYLIPAIDLLDGRCVRLYKGDFRTVTEYPWLASELALKYANAGADWLHVVDLAASRDGAAADTLPLFSLLAECRQNVQTGGGVRNREDIKLRLDAGADRVVVGTLCATQPRRFGDWLDSFGRDRLVAALDVVIDPAGVPWPRIHGWTESARWNLWELLDELVAMGLAHLLCTDISRDGVMAGANSTLYRQIGERYPGLQIQASGGIASLADLEALKTTGVAAAISGKALLEGNFTVEDALGTLS